ncbi:HNH endonuclease [Comamonas badia]|uniref:HNH endonuclease n=1 Tax=Comamonas badia TaxID=265291 RepID=UPI0004660EAA|nr:HNH endonuclease [Comamonas badia]
MPEIRTIKEHIAWSYANLAAAHSAVSAGAKRYGRLNYMIRARLNKGLVSGAMSMRSLLDDEKVKYQYPHSCCYCGSTEQLHMDHLIPKIKGGPDTGDNIVWCCRSCNSSKRDSDVIRWLESKRALPSILLLRRYLKLITAYCLEHGLMDSDLAEVDKLQLPFDIMAIPYKLPEPGELVLWVKPKQS